MPQVRADYLVGGQGRGLDLERCEDFDSCECARRALQASAKRRRRKVLGLYGYTNG